MTGHQSLSGTEWKRRGGGAFSHTYIIHLQQELLSLQTIGILQTAKLYSYKDSVSLQVTWFIETAKVIQMLNSVEIIKHYYFIESFKWQIESSHYTTKVKHKSLNKKCVSL